jgi:hypothetical protein
MVAKRGRVTKPAKAVKAKSPRRTIAASKNPIIVRTSFANARTWTLVREIVARPVDDGYLANVDYIDDPAFDGVTKDELLELIGKKYEHAFIVIADGVTMSGADHALLVVDLDEQRGSAFRALPSQMQSIENNLSLSNMDFVEFAENVGRGGVFRGF